ncbi:MAG: methylenetetrahydrofolate--tRNA-(uracil(54)-C(5))-methyltransferase (FADH(2)-oxidizing) TrmFO [Clostridia bacterium]|nr:methylenetetrahydrofolate--tRNA-(uracil(54)-C(5))-methyltransferase (FADH(2)-oxidizing) TrmFO [Clostridia bacterium]
MHKIKVIGGGLAGSETAYYLAENGVKVQLYDVKPNKFTPAHSNKNFGELVCSNSLKSNDVYGNAAGLLKEELRILGSLIIESADQSKVPAGNALAVNRDEFAEYITEKLKNHPNIEIISQEVEDFDFDEYTVIATGPLTTGKLNDKIKEITDTNLHFFDASAPIVMADSIDMENAFLGDRYDKGNGDHINCPMNKEQYLEFIEKLLSAERAKLHDFENKEIFEGCMPIEIMASRGTDTLRFGPLKPVGLTDPKTGRWAYACLQLRKEDQNGSMYNLVGFQTNLTFPEQKRVFLVIPALKNAEYARYGVMHRNTFINSPEILNPDYSLINHPKTFFAGQITGVEGYVESAMSGLLVGIHLLRRLKGLDYLPLPEGTVMGALTKYITTKNQDFQPMNANFGILSPLNCIIRDKAERKRQMAERSLTQITAYKKEI